MYQITVEGRFSAAHRHLLPPGESGLHGHDFLVRVQLEGERLVNDVLIDFHDLEVELRELLGEVDHRDLATHPAFAGREATPAALARWLHDRLIGRFPPGDPVRLAWVELSDGEATAARYSSG